MSVSQYFVSTYFQPSELSTEVKELGNSSDTATFEKQLLLQL